MQKVRGIPRTQACGVIYTLGPVFYYNSIGYRNTTTKDADGYFWVDGRTRVRIKSV